MSSFAYPERSGSLPRQRGLAVAAVERGCYFRSVERGFPSRWPAEQRFLTPLLQRTGHPLFVRVQIAELPFTGALDNIARGHPLFVRVQIAEGSPCAS